MRESATKAGNILGEVFSIGTPKTGVSPTKMSIMSGIASHFVRGETNFEPDNPTIRRKLCMCAQLSARWAQTLPIEVYEVWNLGSVLWRRKHLGAGGGCSWGLEPWQLPGSGALRERKSCFGFRNPMEEACPLGVLPDHPERKGVQWGFVAPLPTCSSVRKPASSSDSTRSVQRGRWDARRLN